MSSLMSEFSHYAVLIGINAYSEKPLESCVRDVEDMENCLKNMPRPVHIQKLTATTGSDSSHPAEEPNMWPTFDNVISNLRQTTLLAKTGDFVYVHFSGHGTTCEPTGDTALVVLEATTKAGIRYLRGEELANLIKIMVDKGLIVTLVLDCCFSGSVMRNDSSTRYLKYNSEVDAAHPPESRLNTEGESSRTIYRNTSMRSNWLIDPDGYSILTACGPTEETKDLFDDKGQRHGALSYFLLRVFAKLGHFRGQQRNIYSHLCARFRETRNQRKNEQNPMLYGNKNLSFFGPVGPENNFMPVPIMKRQNHGLQLEAGHAHGVCDDDKFFVYSLHSADNEFESRDLAIARVSQVRALTSDLEVLNGTPIPSDSGLIGIALTHLFLRRFPVRLELGLPYPEQWTRALQDRPSLDIYNNDHKKLEPSFSFYVAITGDNSYEIRDESNQSIQNLPTPAHDLGENAGSHILDMVEHLAMFKMVKQIAKNPLENKAHPFTESFDVKLINAAGNVFNPGCSEQCNHRECMIEAELSEKLELFVRNIGGDCLYLHIFNNQHMDFNQGTTGEWRKKLEMQVPPRRGEREHLDCEDIIKVFLTNQPTSFMSLELPEIGKNLERNGYSRTRGDGGGLLSENWAARNFRIRSTVK